MISKRLSLISMALAASVFVATDAFAEEADWPSAGADLGNSRYQDKERRISARTVGSLQLKWTFDTAATSRRIRRSTASTCTSRIRQVSSTRSKRTPAAGLEEPISDYTGIAGDFARGTPAVTGKLLDPGQPERKVCPGLRSARAAAGAVFAVDKRTGDMVWSTQVDDTALSFVTQSAIVYKDTAFVGVASNEELIAAFVPPANWQWQFRGSVVALDVDDGKIKWKTYTVPPGYAAAACGEAPARSTRRTTRSSWRPATTTPCRRAC